MAKYYGKIGYGVTTETVPGVWTDGITEKDAYGDVIRNTRNFFIYYWKSKKYGKYVFKL